MNNRSGCVCELSPLFDSAELELLKLGEQIDPINLFTECSSETECGKRRGRTFKKRGGGEIISAADPLHFVYYAYYVYLVPALGLKPGEIPA